jgi:hypothetical protein
VAELRALTDEELGRAEFRLRNPAPGSRIEAARQYGVDVTLLIEQLRLTPAERVRRMLLVAQTAENVRGAARRRAG